LDEQLPISDQSKRLKKVGYWQRDRPKIIRFVNFKETKEPNKLFREPLMMFYPWRLPHSDVAPGTLEAGALEDEAILVGAVSFETRYREVLSILEVNRNRYVKDITVDLRRLQGKLKRLTMKGVGVSPFQSLIHVRNTMTVLHEAKVSLPNQGENRDEIPDVYDIATDLGTRVEGYKSKVEYVDNIREIP
jgi:hypothetical protein